MTVTEVEWAEPPPPKRYDRRAFVDAVKHRPGVWAQYRPGVAHTSNTARQLRAYGLQVTARRRPDSTPDRPRYDVFVRWNDVL